MVKKIRFRLVMLLSAGALTACGLAGPNYQRPEAVATMPTAYKEGEGWKLAQPQDSLAGERWWELYGDPQLSGLVAQVGSGNQNMRAAAVRVRQARAVVQAARAGGAPSATGGGSAAQARRSENTGAGTGDMGSNSDLQLPLQVAWELDLWGKVERGMEASAANLAASSADLAAGTLSAEAELVGDYFQIQALDAQKQLLETTLSNYRRILEITRNRYTAGVVGKGEALQAENQVQNVEAQLVDLETQRAPLEHAIAVLLGSTPAAFSLPPLALSATIPVLPPGLPSELVERRPDIAGAERRMAAANAQIGVAAAAFFPTIRLGASGGVESSALSTLLSWPSRFWSLGPTLSTTLFDGGLRQAQSEQALAAYDGAVAVYRQSVLTAFREVEDALAILRSLEEEARLQEAAVQTARQSLAVVTKQYQVGTVSYLNLLVAQTALLSNERTATAIQSRRLAASVSLVKALGGGWQERQTLRPRETF